jgi:hypothetical protein
MKVTGANQRSQTAKVMRRRRPNTRKQMTRGDSHCFLCRGARLKARRKMDRPAVRRSRPMASNSRA